MRLLNWLLMSLTCFMIIGGGIISSNNANAQKSPRRATNPHQTMPTTFAPEISYTVSMPNPATHLLEVEMRVAATGNRNLPPQLNLVMPVWTPGSYLIREYARHVQDFAAVKNPVQQANMPSLTWRKINKNTWQVATDGAREVRVTYRVYSNELTVRTNELNDRHAFWNNAALLMFPEGQLNAASTLTVRPYGNWKIATGLPLASKTSTALNELQAGAAQTFRAANYDILYDSPFLLSDFKSFEFTTLGKPHRFVIDGEGNYDMAKLQRDVPKIVEASARLFGNALPYDNYTFLLLAANGGGGLEHLNSTALIARRFSFSNENAYRGFLSLVAHEFYHLWNVKRIKPDALGPFDYANENYTRLLWVAEGITSYYENIILVRAGLMTDKQFLDEVGNSIRALQNTPGRLELSLEEASFDAWIKYYRQDENSINTQVSYYDKGALVGMLLDLEIRRRTGGARSLDDVMRALYTNFALRNRNYTPQDFQATAEEVAGGSLDNFFAAYVRGTQELPFTETLNSFGLTLNARAATDAPAKPYFGANLAQTGDSLIVRNVLADSPAYAQGINAGDVVVAMNNFRVNLQSFNEHLNERKPNDTITLTVFRGDELRTFPVRLGADTQGNYRITPIANPSEQQRKLYQDWLGTTLKAESKSEDDE